MKGSAKGPPSAVLAAWWAANGSVPPSAWGALQNPEKAATLLAALQEQKFVCVYCGGAISATPFVAHLEHFWPRSKFPSLRFDWSNLFASCGPRRKKAQPSICGDAKDDWTPANHIHPADPDCEGHFAYTGQGAIKPSASGGRRAETMIRVLRLDHASLDYQRGQLIAFIERQIADGQIDTTNKTGVIAHWRTPDEQGALPSFGHVVARYLEDEPIA